MLLPCVDKFEKLYKTVTRGIAERLLSSVPGHSTPETGAVRDVEQGKKSRHHTSRKKVEVNPNVRTGNRFGLLLDEEGESSTEEEDEK